MLKLESYYKEALERCESITQEVVANTTAVMVSIKLIEETFLSAGRAVSAATHAAVYLEDNGAQPVSVPAVILGKEMANLMLSLVELKSTVKTRLGSTLQQMSDTLIDAAATTPVLRNESAQSAYNLYREMLIRCIGILEKLEEELFKATSI